MHFLNSVCIAACSHFIDGCNYITYRLVEFFTCVSIDPRLVGVVGDRVTHNVFTDFSINPKNVNLDIPRDKFVVITGLSGSGKSSLAFDTLYAEGQRRYVESLSAYARQFLSQMEKPEVDSIEGLSPAIAIEQKSTSHNLKNVNLDIPRDKFVVITGLSGSGKSSLAFDTLYAEGQRRYVESLSAYARQFLSQMEKPEVDSIEGLSPAIAIEQKSTSHNPRSTVGTITEIYDYLRLLYARVGTPFCPEHDLPMVAQTISEMVDAVKGLDEGTA
jgi:excinuclease UvrABC ATPase subunit